MSVSALSTSKLVSPVVAGVAAARPLHYKNLTIAGIAALTASQIGEMRSVEVAALSNGQIEAFNPVALASGLPTYLNTIWRGVKQTLPTNFIASLGNNQISQFGASLVSATLSKMSTSQIGAISTSAISGISTAALQSLSGAHLSSFTQAQVDELSTAQIAGLKPYQINTVSAAWLNKLSTAQLRQLSGPSTINFVLPKLLASKISAVDASAAIGISLPAPNKLSNDQLKAFTADQFSHFTRESINWVASRKLNIGFSAQQKDAINARKAEPIQEWIRPLGTDGYAAGLTTGNDGSIYASYTNGWAANSDVIDSFVTKFNPKGTEKWTKPLGLGSSALSYAGALTTGKDGSIYVSGGAEGNLDGQTNSGGEDAFITKFNPKGTKQWTKLFGTSADDYTNALTTGKDGSIYVSGSTGGNLDGQTNSGGQDAFITKFNSKGAKQWTKVLGTSAEEYAIALTTGKDGSIYVSGYTGGNLDGQASSGGQDAFITKFNSKGTKQWTKLFGTSADEYANALTTGKDGSIYVSGSTGGNLDGQTNSGGQDAFITKFNSKGTKQWTKLFGTSAQDYAGASTTGKNGSIYVTGGTGGNLDGQTNNGGRDAFITKFKPEGTKGWTRLIGTAADEYAYSIATGKDGSIYVNGGAFDGSTYTSTNAFVTKYSG
jgi:hypothetical protein